MFGLDVDFIQRVKVTGIFFLQIYKILTGTLLTIFVPQSCDTFLIESNTTESRVCTLTQNYENSDQYHQKTMYWNFLTMIIFIGYYIVELRRENWAIQYLDIDNNKPDNSLKEIIVKVPQLDKIMDRLNLYYYYLLYATMFSYFINVVLMIKILYSDYHSSSTISCFISFVLLVMMKLYNSYVVAKESVKNDKMMSAYMSEFVSFNVLDVDYLEDNPQIKELIETNKKYTTEKDREELINEEEIQLRP